MHVVMHNSVSADGQTVGFSPDVALHYELAGTWRPDVHLAGSATIAAALAEDEAAAGSGDAEPEAAPPLEAPATEAPADDRPLLVVCDSAGRIGDWSPLRRVPFWQDRMVALCSEATPATHLASLARQRVDTVTAGSQHVDLPRAFRELEQRYGAASVLVDSGGVLNGVLLDAGLIDEVSLVMYPCIVGGAIAHGAVRPPAGLARGLVDLRRTHLEALRDGIVWLRYAVV